MFFQQQQRSAQNPIQAKVIEQVQRMELAPKDKTKLADYAISRAGLLAQFAWQNWQCSVVAVRVCAHEIRYRVS